MTVCTKIHYIFSTISLFNFYSIMSNDCTALINFNDDCDAQRIDFIALEYNYGLSAATIPGDQITITTTGTGTTGETSGLGFISTPTAGDTVTVRTRRTVPLNPRDEAYAIFAVRFTQLIPSGSGALTQWIGLFDTENGIAVGYPTVGVTFSILYRNNGVDTTVPQTSFNVDRLNGTGPSGFLFIPANLNTFRVSYAWYGTNIIRYQILGTDGEWITFHEIENINNQTIAAFSNPYLPMSMNQINTSVTPITARMETTAWRAGLIHSGENNAGIRTFEAQRTFGILALLPGLGENYMFTIRNKATVGGETNRVSIKLLRFGGGNGLDGVVPAILRYYKNTTVAGAAFTDVSTPNSVVEVDTTGSPSGGHLLWTMGHAGLRFELLPEESVEFILGPGETLTVTAEKVVPLVAITLYATAIWEELQ